ncbi:MAG: adenosylcobinamide-phosphate synthase CbiB [Desulfobacteraceae bacterium]|nr:adenosylcobinamide-phosphate synthase CbiB [Desulfobacteraceae bacterium]
MPAWILPSAVALDLVLGDPRRLPHPVRWMGFGVSRLEPWFRRIPLPTAFSGALLAILLITLAGAAAWAAVAAATVLSGTLGDLVAVVLLYYCLAIRSLQQSAMEVFRILEMGNLDGARRSVSMIVGRDTRNLSPQEIARAAVETVAENLVDGVLSPLFFFAIGGVPAAMAYKMINTLDSMIGHRDDRYREFGKAAARIDDAANWIPARLAVWITAVAAWMVAGRGRAALECAWLEGRRHTSPNAGRIEAAFAGALGVTLGGPSVYRGRLVDKPEIGTGFSVVQPRHIPRACELMVLASLIGSLLAGCCRWWIFP